MAGNTIGDSVVGFSIDLYRQILAKDGPSGNIFYSPFSISAALSMALAGSRNNTAKELATALKVEGDGIHQSFSDFLAKLPGYAPDVKLHIANKLYSEVTFPALESYLSVLKSSYSTTIESVDFKNDAEKVRAAINVWVESVTQKKIKNLLPTRKSERGDGTGYHQCHLLQGAVERTVRPEKDASLRLQRRLEEHDKSGHDVPEEQLQDESGRRHGRHCPGDSLPWRQDFNGYTAARRN
ncbi:hypothetical protein HPB48_000753 [Haemaphysalis longicornis]|uniref:Serpin domain-containing protein n=1 Tax=Haemaphysalis longicornis TaxID=44386 RepID=A0A9J6GI45_HAELO|nr:hypothetical protein HPB48_000753 [Haemaphysalis longicornis]